MRFTINIKGVITTRQMIKILKLNKIQGKDGWNDCINQLIAVIKRDYP